MDIMQLVDELEAVISKSFRIPFTANVIVNEDALFDIIDQMRVSIPREIKEARRTEAERERILARAREESERLISMAKDKMMSAVDDHEIIEAARRQARETLAQAEQEAEQLKADSRAYVVDNLSALEEHLLKLLTTVRNGLRQLEAGGGPPVNPHTRPGVQETATAPRKPEAS